MGTALPLTICLICSVGILTLQGVSASQKLSPQQLRDAADKIVSTDTKKAIQLYTEAIAAEKLNPLNLYKRSVAYLRLRRYTDVIDDLNKAIAVDPEFTRAYVNLGKVHKMRGDCALARSTFEQLLKVKPGNAVALEEVTRMNECVQAMELADRLFHSGRYSEARDAYTKAIEHASESNRLLHRRAECNVKLGDHQSLLMDTRMILKNDDNDLHALLLGGKAYYALGEYEAALNHFRHGLRTATEHKELKDIYRVVKQLTKLLQSGEDSMTNQDWAAAVESFEHALLVDPSHQPVKPKLYQKICEGQSKLRKWDAAVAACNQLLEIDDSNVEGYLLRADAHMATEQWDRAAHDYQRAAEIQPNNQRAREGLHRAKNDQKRAARKDYYKILGVARDASTPAIKKAYRQMALKYHPDKASEDEKESATKRFHDIGEAYEVLTNDDLRQRYDAGEDVNGGPQQQQQQHHGFPGGFGFPFGGGGGGQTFTFTFG